MSAVAIADKIKNGLPLGRILPLFPVEHEVIPSPLREIAAWLAGLDTHFRNWLITHDPITAAQGDTIRYTSAERENLITSLANRFRDRVWQRDFDRFGDLARSVSDNVLHQLLQPANSTAVRHMVMEMIDAAKTGSLYPDLLQIAIDSNTESRLRAKAATILANQAPIDYASKMYPLLTLPADQDNDDEICGTLLYRLYPNHLTTEQALSALRVPRNYYLFGIFRHFWELDFFERKQFTSDERQQILNAIDSLLKLDGDSIKLHSLVELFIRLLLVELKEKDPNIDRLGLWLVKLADWVRYHEPANKPEYQQFIQTLRAMPNFRAQLYRWQLKNWSTGKDFSPWWDLPFYGRITTDDELPMFIEICQEYSAKPEIGIAIFELLVSLVLQAPQMIRLEVVEELAGYNLQYDAYWQKRKVSEIDGPAARMHKQHLEFNKQIKNRETDQITYVQNNVEALSVSNVNFILFVIHEVNFEPFGDVPVEAIKERYGSDVAQAIYQALLEIWDGLTDISGLWPYSNNLPNLAIVAGYGYRLRQPQLKSLNQQQVDYLIWRMLHDSKTSLSLTELWEFNPDMVWRRLMDSIRREWNLPENSHPMVWQFLNSAESLPNGLMDEIVNYVTTVGIPAETRARRYALRILLRSSRRDEVLRLVSDQVNHEWCGQALPVPWVENAALSTLAAWWLLDADTAFDVLEGIVLQGPRHPLRVIGFINGLLELQGNYLFNNSWSVDVSWQSYAKLLPLLYAQPPRAGLQLGGGFVTPADQFAQARDSLIIHISKAPPALSCAWFGAWKEDERYGIHRDWFARIFTELVQRQADESWSPLPIETVNQILGKEASLIRNDNDLMLLLEELIAQQLVPAFRSDYSLVPLLWSGTKSSGRTHVEEKALQTAIFGQLKPMIQTRRIIGVREPEVFDGKKPDVFLTYILGSGVTVDVPVEVKWADHAELWTAIETQLLKKYMPDPRVKYGIYLVGWIGSSVTQNDPNGEKPLTPNALQSELQLFADQCLTNTDKKITVYVLDASVQD